MDEKITDLLAPAMVATKGPDPSDLPPWEAPPEEEPPPRANRKPVPQEIRITARQFVRARKYHWDQAAGFLHDMKLKYGPGARKIRDEWERLWTAFWQRPV